MNFNQKLCQQLSPRKHFQLMPLFQNRFPNIHVTPEVSFETIRHTNRKSHVQDIQAYYVTLFTAERKRWELLTLPNCDHNNTSNTGRSGLGKWIIDDEYTTVLTMCTCNVRETDIRGIQLLMPPFKQNRGILYFFA